MSAPYGEPFELFDRWFQEAAASEPEDANAMALATADAQGRPSLRMVLLKGVDERGFVFYTNLGSRKGRQLQENPHAALGFHWKSLRRQVRVEGAVEPVTAEEADAYFATRHRSSQIGAWASRQSQPMTARLELERRVAEFTARFGFGRVPRPHWWSGFRVLPARIEFWQQGAFRLHERTLYMREGDVGEGGGWQTQRLFP
jgi:pyridoxamine 5'-phosphate oxidase